MSADQGHQPTADSLAEGQPYTQEQITEELVTVLSSFVDEELLRQCRDQTSGATLLECVRRATLVSVASALRLLFIGHD